MLRQLCYRRMKNLCKLLKLSVLILLTGCQFLQVSPEKFTNSWLNENINDFIYEVGLPFKKIALSDGREVYTHEYVASYEGNSLYCSCSVLVNDDEKINNIRFSGSIGGCNRLISILKNRQKKT